MKRKLLLLGVLLSFGLGQATQAQESKPALSLENCISLAKERNLSLQEQKLRLEQAKMRHSASLNAFLPTASANVGQSLSFGRSQDKRGVYVDRSSSSTSFGISANLELFSGLRRLNNRKASKFGYQASKAGLAEAKESLEVQITQLYFTWLYTYYSYEATKAQTERFKTQTDYAEEMVRVGKWSRDKFLEAKTSLANAQNNELNALNQLSLAKLSLAQAIEQDVDSISLEVMPIADELLRAEAYGREEASEVFAQALSNRPSFERSRLELASSKSQIASARSGYLPRLSLNLGYGNSYYYLIEDKYSAFNQPFSEQWKQNGRSYIGLSLGIPLFDGFRTRTQIRSAKLDYQFRHLAYQRLCKKVKKEIVQAKMNAHLAKQKMKSSALNLKMNQELAELMGEKLRLGQASQLEYRQAMQNELSAKQDKIRSEIDYCLKARLLNFYKRQGEQ